MCDLVVEVDELCKRLAHDELGSCLHGLLDTLDIVNVLEEFARCLVVAAYDVAGTGFALVSQCEHCVCNVSYVNESTSAALRRDGTVIKITVEDLVNLIILGIAGADDECRKHHYGIESVECNLLHDISCCLSL